MRDWVSQKKAAVEMGERKEQEARPSTVSSEYPSGIAGQAADAGNSEE